jgi:hypothetical protein
LAYSHGVYPLIYKTLKNYQDEIPSQTLVNMKLIYMDLVKQNMLMTKELLDVVKLLEENCIEAIAFKGPTLSQLAYGDVVSRQYVDLDILVRDNDLDKAQNVLLENNYSLVYDLDEYQKENLKDVVHDIAFINKTTGVNIELHWTLSSGEFFIDLEKLDYLSDVKKYQIQNNDINVFSNEKLFIYLCVHGHKHLWERIEWLVDIVYLIEKENIDLEKVIELSKQVDADRIVLSTLLICQKMFEIMILEEFDCKKLIVKTDKFYKQLLNNYDCVHDKNNNREVSMNQFYMLKNFTYRKKYIKSFFLPTQKDFESVNLPKYLYFVYYIIRPVNIVIRYFTK